MNTPNSCSTGPKIDQRTSEYQIEAPKNTLCIVYKSATGQKRPLSCSMQSQLLFYMSSLFCLGWRLCGFPSILWSAVMGTLWLCEYSVDRAWGMTFNQRVALQKSRWTGNPRRCFQELSHYLREEFQSSLICLNSLESDTYYMHQLECFFLSKRDAFPPHEQRVEFFFFPWHKCYSLCLSEWNVLWEVFNTSETEQEEGGILTSAGECLARIRSA